MLCLRVIHEPGLSNDDLTKAISTLVENWVFGPFQNTFIIGRTFSNLIIIFQEQLNLPTQATTVATQVAKVLGLSCTNHPAKYIEDY